MIVRINLSPNRKVKVKPSPKKNILIVLVIVLFIEIIACVYVSSNLDEEINGLVNRESDLTTQRDELKQKLGNVEKMKKEIEELRSREMTFAKLASLRTGPQYVLNELARILSNPREIVARKAASAAEWSLTWEPENVIITSFKDLGNSQIEIEGTARTMDDISEFWKRMKTSPLMRNVRLGEIKDSKEGSLNIVTQKFSFTADVNFNYQTQDGLSLIDMLTTQDDKGADAGSASSDGQAL